MPQSSNRNEIDRFESLPLRRTPIITSETDSRTLRAALTELEAGSVPIRNTEGVVGYFKPHEIVKALFLKKDARKKFLQRNYNHDQVSVESKEPIFPHLERILSGPDGPIFVTESKQFIGYIPRRNLLEAIVKQLTINLADIADRDQHVTVQQNDSIYAAHKAMLNASAKITMVVNQEGILIGTFNAVDLPALIEAGENLWNTRIDSVMQEPAFIKENTSLNEAYQVILRKRVKQLVVIDNEGHPNGIIEGQAIFNALHPSLAPSSSRTSQKQNKFIQTDNSRHLPESLIVETVLNRTIKTGIIGLDNDLNVIYFNPAARDFFNKNMPFNLKSATQGLSETHGDREDSFNCSLSQAIQNKKREFTLEISDKSQNRIIQCKLSPIQQSSKVLGYVIAIQDITAPQNTENTIKRLAYYDSLTTLPNRVLFNERMNTEIKRVKRERERMALMILDLDGFKDVNDQHGHIAGDRLLQTIAKRLKKAIRESDTVGRFGGDEFTFLFPKIHEADAVTILTDKLRKAVSTPVHINHDTVSVSASIGVAFFPDDGKRQETLFKVADKRMYAEKRKHKREQATSRDASKYKL